MKYFLFLIGYCSGGSNSPDYIKNPENYYRDPCPDTRPETRCNAFDEYVWRNDGKFKWELKETYDDPIEFPNVIVRNNSVITE